MQRVVRTEDERKLFIQYVTDFALPFTASVAKGANRSVEQNRLQRLWINQISEQWDGHNAEGIRAYCKLHIGVPILREEDAEFREKYDRIIKPLPYEMKIELMQEPMDFPVTRIMTTKQKKTYLDNVFQHFASQGFELTDPEEGEKLGRKVVA